MFKINKQQKESKMVKRVAAGLVLVLVLSVVLFSSSSYAEEKGLVGYQNDSRSKYSDSKYIVKFGVITDVHYDPRRGGSHSEAKVKDFVKDMNNSFCPDFVIEVGDFGNMDGDWGQWDYINAVFDDCAVPEYHVIGNHDVRYVKDYRRNCLATVADCEADKNEWMTRTGYNRYYSFDVRGILHVIVLDTIEFADGTCGFDPKEKADFIGDVQLKWVERDLDNTDLPVIVFSHQTISNIRTGGLRVRKKLENFKDKGGVVIACFNGHLHRNDHRVINGINYYTLEDVVQWFPPDQYNKTLPDTAYSRISIDVNTKKVYVEGVGKQRTYGNLIQ